MRHSMADVRTRWDVLATSGLTQDRGRGAVCRHTGMHTHTDLRWIRDATESEEHSSPLKVTQAIGAELGSKQGLASS